MTANSQPELDPALATLVSQLADDISRRLQENLGAADDPVRTAARAIAVQIREIERQRQEFDDLVDQIVSLVQEEKAQLDAEPLETESVDTADVLPADTPGSSNSGGSDSSSGSSGSWSSGVTSSSES